MIGDILWSANSVISMLESPSGEKVVADAHNDIANYLMRRWAEDSERRKRLEEEAKAVGLTVWRCPRPCCYCIELRRGEEVVAHSSDYDTGEEYIRGFIRGYKARP